MTDKKFLQWIHDRLHYQHGEKVDVDYMHKLRAIINSTPDDQITPNVTTVFLRKVPLEEILSLIPVSVSYKGKKVMFALQKRDNGFWCTAYYTDAKSMDTVIDFNSEDPAAAVAMMFGFLKGEKLI